MAIALKHIWPWIWSLVMIAAGCRQKDREDIDAFDMVVKLEAPGCLADDSLCPLGNIECIGYWRGCLVLQHSDAQNVFTLIDTSGQVSRSFCQVGHGRNECLSAGHDFTVEGSVLSFYDRQAKLYCSFNLEDVIQDNDSLTLKKIRVPYVRDFRPSHVTSMGDRFLCMGCFSDERFGCFARDGERILHGIDYPFTTDGLMYLEKGTVYQGFMLSSPENEKFVIATYASDVFEVYDASGPVILRTYVNPYKRVPPVVESGGRKTIQTEKCIAGLMGGCATADAFYFLYSEAGYEDGYQSSVILSFSWDGSRRVKYCLPFPIKHFSVSSGHLYAVSESDNINRVYDFHLPSM